MTLLVKKMRNLVLGHRVIAVFLVLAILGGGYLWYRAIHGSSSSISYTTQPVRKETIVASVSGSGQVSPSNQIDIKSKVSEPVTYVGVKNGQFVRAGTLLMQFDTADAQKSVRNATISLQNSKLSLLKLAGSDSLAVPLNKQQAQDNLDQVYTNGFNTIAKTFLDLPGVMTHLQDIIFGNQLSRSSQNIDYYTDYTKPYNEKASDYKNDVLVAYQKALASYNKSFDGYKSLSRNSSHQEIDDMVSETYQTSQDISDAIKNINNLIQFYEDVFTKQQFAINPAATTQLATINTDTGKTNGDLSNLLSAQSSIKNAKSALINADLDISSQSLNLQQAQNSLADANDTLANCSLYAPFDGIVADAVYRRGDIASSGSTAITFITNQSITEIPFNEVDIIRIKEGQKAVLTFDAIDGLTVAGVVQNVSTLGTVTQGVVNYNVKIAFDSSNTRIKPGMSISASIITDVKQDALVVPNSAVKQSSSGAYVQVMENGVLREVMVTLGITNDTDTQIIEGLKEQDMVVTQTVTSVSNATNAAAAQGGALRLQGLTGGSVFGGGGRNTAGR